MFTSALLQQQVEAIGLASTPAQDIGYAGGLLFVVIDFVDFPIVLVVEFGVKVEVGEFRFEAGDVVHGLAGDGASVGQGPDIGQERNTLKFATEAKEILVVAAHRGFQIGVGRQAITGGQTRRNTGVLAVAEIVDAQSGLQGQAL